MLEKIVEMKCIKIAKEHGFMFEKWHGSGNAGKPDRILIGHGKIRFVELKRSGVTKPTKLQDAWHRKANLCFGRQIVYVVNDPSVFEEILIALKGG